MSSRHDVYLISQICHFPGKWGAGVSRTLSSGPMGPASRLASRNTVMYTLIASGARKILRGCNVLQVPIQNYTSGGIKSEEPSPHLRIKIVMDHPLG